jgi:hypothetical protein
VDGRYIVVGLTLVLPAVLIAVTVAWFSSNVIVMLVLFSMMLLGCLYLLSYSESFTGVPSES